MFGFAVYAQGLRTFDQQPGCIVNGVPTLKCLEVVAGNIVFFASSLIILVLLIMFIIGAFSYMTSLGNPERVKKAQSTLRYALLGFALFAGSFLILRVIGTLFLDNPSSLFIFRIPSF